MTAPAERVLLRLDAALDWASALDTAAHLAARWRVPLHAVFVEDEELLHLSQLPFARQVSLHAGREPLTRRQVEMQGRAMAERARREVAAATARHDVAWSFAIGHGPGAAAAGDFVVAGAATRPIGRHFRLRARHHHRRPPEGAHALLLARRPWRSGGPVAAILSRRDAEAARLLELASALAGLGGGVLHVLGGPEIAAPEAFAAWVAGRLADRPVRVAPELAALDRAQLQRRLAALDCRLVALGAGHAGLEDIVECDVLMLRRDAAADQPEEPVSNPRPG